MVEFSETMEKLGTRIIRDLVAKGCSRWQIMKVLGVSYNAVTDMWIGKYCHDRHVSRLQEFRYKYFLEKGIPLFPGE
jgi:hypothetical protein